MLKSQEAASEQPSLSAGQARVTPEELTNALAAIETRKQAEASRLAGTIPIEDAVSELHLDSTPEEIWAEVQLHREKASVPPPQSFEEAEAARLEQVRQSLAAQASALAAPVITPLRIQLPPGRRRFLRPFIPFLAAWALFSTGIIPHAWHHLTYNNPSVATVSLAQIPDGKAMYADSTALMQVSEGVPLTKVQVRYTHTGNDWTLVKLSHHVYLHGYIAMTDSLPNIADTALNVYNDDNSGELEGERTSNITLRVDKIPLQKSGGDDDYSKITVPDFQPDRLTTLSPWR